MTNSSFRVYNASAGSGKTYNLVFNYLNLCLGGASRLVFRSILAITFTNKAAGEMKNRIIGTLKAFVKYPESGKEKAMFEDIMDLNQLSEEELKERSHDLLRLILHQYSALSVSTIDKFTNRLIRSFASDLKLSTTYDVELDTGLILTEAIDLMLSDLEEGSALAEVLIQFLNSQLKEGKSPRAESRLLEIGYSLFQERALTSIEKLKKLTPEEFLTIRGQLYGRNEKIEKEIRKIAISALDVIDNNSIDHKLFSSSYLPKYLLKVINVDAFYPPSLSVQKQINEDTPLYAKTKQKVAGPVIDPISGILLEKCRQLLNYRSDHYFIYKISDLILNDIFSIAVLAEIERRLEQVKTDSNRLPIGEFNKLVSEKLREQPAAFLYEKMGNRYEHFFIDEFQDTSLLQWANLVPLINNSIAQRGTATIVGDGKQSIYRWRGGEVEQFLDLNTGRDHSNKVMVGEKAVELYSRETISLDYNWRSRKNIVEFNNDFFKTIVDVQRGKEAEHYIANEDHRKLFKNAHQQVKGSEGGYVEISRYAYEDEESYILKQCQKCLEIITEAQEAGYSLKDIAILNRKISNSIVLSEYLLNKGIAVVSPDSLQLGQSEEVRALISFLNILVRPYDKQARLPLLKMIWDNPVIKEKYEERHLFLEEWAQAVQYDFLQKIKDAFTQFDTLTFQNSSLPEKINEMAHLLGFNVLEDPFLQTLLDEAVSYDQHKDEGVAGFLRWWETGGMKTAIDLTDDLDAIRMMTIHKAKGLEFPIVILAFADWTAFTEQNPTSWMTLEAEKFFGLPAARLGLKKLETEMPNMEEYASMYVQNKNNIALDNLNLLYVALTRAVDQLYILGTEGRRDTERITLYLKHYMSTLEEDSLIWHKGEKTAARHSKDSRVEHNASSYPWVSWKNRLRVTTDSPKNWEAGLSTGLEWGKKVHTILSYINSAEDIETVVARLIGQGDFSNEEQSQLTAITHQVLTHRDLKYYYAEGVTALNEQEILLPGNKSFRPDRIVKVEDVVHIIDYKTGSPSERHQQQVNRYAEILSQMGMKTGDRLLVYLNDTIDVVKW